MRNDVSTAAPRDRRTRRQILAAATGGIGALAAQAALPAAPAQAAQGQAVIEGHDNTGATARTAVFTPGNKEFGILADPNSSGKGSIGVYGGGQDAGVRGQGLGTEGTGVIGIGATPDGTGVFGQSAGSYGVVGQTESNADGAPAVFGQNAGSGIGVAGLGGIGVQAAGDIALQVLGPAQFQRSGKATIRYPEKSATVVVPGGLAAGSLALATLQTGINGVFVAAAVSDAAHGKLRIDLNKAPGTASRPRAATVAWFIVN